MKKKILHRSRRREEADSIKHWRFPPRYLLTVARILLRGSLADVGNERGSCPRDADSGRQRRPSYQPRATPWVHRTNIIGSAEGAVHSRIGWPDEAGRWPAPGSITTHPRALPWAGINQAFGLRAGGSASSLQSAQPIRGHELIVFAVSCVILLGGCERETKAPSKPEPPVEVKLIKPFRGSITRSIILPGEIKPYQQATLYAKVAGYLKTITVDKGDPVKAGDLIADIEVPEMQADLARYKAEAEVAELDYKRLSESLKKAPDLVVPQTVDDAKGKFDVARANVERTQTLLNYAKLTAPFAGIVTRRMVDPGAFIPAATSGSAAQNAALVTLTDFNRVRIQVAVPEVEAPLVRVELPIELATEGLPGRKFEGRITRFSYALDDATKTMLAEIELANPKLELRPGMYAMVKIGIERKDNALLVPVDALLSEKAGASVFTVANGKAKKVKVQTGFNDGTNVELLKGIDPSEPVILLGKRVLSDGQPVQASDATK